MATDAQLSEAAIGFIERSDNCNPEMTSQTMFGLRGRGYIFEYDQQLKQTVVMEWEPYVDGNGVFHEACWEGDSIKSFIGGIALVCGIDTNEEEIDKVVGTIKLHLPGIDG